MTKIKLRNHKILDLALLPTSDLRLLIGACTQEITNRRVATQQQQLIKEGK